LNNIEERWAWQHARQTALWPERESAGGVAWTCPLHMLQAHACSESRRSVRSPSRARNAFRFAHIIGPSPFAHPVVATSRTLLLMPGRFMSPAAACTADAEGAPACHSSQLLRRSVAHVRELLWQMVAFPKAHSTPGASCPQILD